MLAYVLALVVGLSSVALYMAAFFFPEVHRKNDFLWSGLGMFYALVLWVCAGRITGGVLLGQTTSVALLGWLGWQTLVLRRQAAPLDQQTAVPTAAEWQSMVAKAWESISSAELVAPLAKPIGKQFAKLAAWAGALVATSTNTTPPSPPTVDSQAYVPLTPADFANASQARIQTPAVKTPQTIAPTKVSVPSSKIQPGESPITAIGKQVQGAFKGLTAKRESKPVYVRKQFRTPDVEPAPAAVDPAALDVAAVKLESDRVAATPSVSDVVEAAIVDAEATVSPTTVPSPTASSPSLDAEILPDPDVQSDDPNLLR
ncbi:Ycf66 family protein [Phormidium sp. FACHB-592]|uniref:Ycf66 family protein n=1 Tax=Stenomitos frigidus AS-A4 TaxID=2933935 RepID=A0ABV0KE37_9CYAN|nr:Ycf66 family protein [Phormidium sp. FACHB-592]MBD2075925.1 Ycf66 family protein [Phormidium sp. FACHB-592]